MKKQSAILEDERSKRSTIDELISTPWHKTQGDSPIFSGMYQLYDNNMQDMYTEKSAAVKEAGPLKTILENLKAWWASDKDKKKDVKKDVKEPDEEEKVANNIKISDDPVQDAYWQAFAEKCAEAEVNPAEAAEAMFRLSGDL